MQTDPELSDSASYSTAWLAQSPATTTTTLLYSAFVLFYTDQNQRRCGILDSMPEFLKQHRHDLKHKSIGI